MRRVRVDQHPSTCSNWWRKITFDGDSLGEYLALGVSLEDLGNKTDNVKAKALAHALSEATSKFLDANKNPSRKVKELDNRGSHFYLALYWAQALAAQSISVDLREKFKKIAADLESSEAKIIKELIDCQGKKVDIGGYYRPDPAKAEEVMCPSQTLNNILKSFSYIKPASKL